MPGARATNAPPIDEGPGGRPVLRTRLSAPLTGSPITPLHCTRRSGGAPDSSLCPRARLRGAPAPVRGPLRGLSRSASARVTGGARCCLRSVRGRWRCRWAPPVLLRLLDRVPRSRGRAGFAAVSLGRRVHRWRSCRCRRRRARRSCWRCWRGCGAGRAWRRGTWGGSSGSTARTGTCSAWRASTAAAAARWSSRRCLSWCGSSLRGWIGSARRIASPIAIATTPAFGAGSTRCKPPA
jgi:hypothetical protein